MENTIQKPAPIRGWKKRLFIALTVILSCFACLMGVEILLRVRGHQPWTDLAEPGQPILHEPDSVLGWRNKEGYYRPGFASAGPDVEVTYLPGGRRRTGPPRPPGDKIMAIVGCSFTQGWGISDHETFSWKLQSKYPDVEIDNYGTAGYGTYQCQLLLERLFREPPYPSVVLYGYIWHHEDRNIATEHWLRVLSRQSSRRHVDLPYCTLDESGNLQRHAPEQYLGLPLRKHLATSHFIERKLMEARTASRQQQRRAVTEKLLAEMNDLCRDHGTMFAMAVLRADQTTTAHYAHFCKDRGITFIDCNHEWTPDRTIPEDQWHPNGIMHDLYAESIDRAIGRHLRANK